MSEKSRLTEMVDGMAAVEDSKRRQSEADRITKSHPKGWEPGVSFDGETGVISTGPMEKSKEPSGEEWRQLLQVWDLDPDVYEVDPNYSPEFRAWDANLGRDPATGEPEVKRFYYYKARIRLKGSVCSIPVDEILDGIKKWKRLKNTHPVGPASLLVCPSDWQIGKALADDTEVLTTAGWTTHGELQPGDFVYGVDGAPVKVTDVTPSTVQECYTVFFDNGDQLVASGDHVWRLDSGSLVKTKDMAAMRDGFTLVKESPVDFTGMTPDSSCVSPDGARQLALRFASFAGTSVEVESHLVDEIAISGLPYGPKESRWSFIDGLFPRFGDSSTMHFCTEHAASVIGWIANTLGFNVHYSIVYPETGHAHRDFEFHRIELMPDNRKNIVNVTPCGPVSAKCITVDADDGVYLVSHAMTPTHNSDRDGVQGTVDRIMTSFERIEDHIDSLRRQKVGLECLYVVTMGDMVEQCAGHYPSQQFSVDLNRKEQIRLSSRLLRDGCARLARKVDKAVVSGVGGNHGENRINNKSFTSDGDNDDLLLLEMVSMAFRENDEAFGHVKFHIPEERLWVVLDLSGVVVGFTHGQVAGRGSTPQEKQRNWLREMAFSEQSIGDAKLLVTGHYHHFSIVDYGPKVHIQCPTVDGGSIWFENVTGLHSTPGTLCAVVGDQFPMGFDHVRVL